MKLHSKMLVLILSVTGLLASLPALAVSTLHIGSGYGTPCATGGCPITGGEVNAIGDTLSIYQNSGGAPALNDPLYLILGAVNDTASGTALSGASLGPATLYHSGGSSESVSLGPLSFMSLMTAGQEAYSVAGFSAPNNSNSFTNWSQWVNDVLGITASNFGIYRYQVNTATFAGKDLIDVALSNIPQGTFAIAYGTDASGKAYGTPFTEAGLTVKVPEPGTLALLTLGLVGVLGVGRRGFSAGKR